MKIIPSNRGGSKLRYQGYMYTKHATRKTNQWWKCVKRSSTGCRGSLSTTLQNENPVPGQPHNHVPSDTSIKYSQTKNIMKDLATNTRDKPSQIFAQVVSQVWRQCPSLAAPWRKPQTHNSIPASNSSSLSHLCRCQIAWRVHNNYQQPTVPAIRMLVFYSPDSLERLANAQTFFIFMDGTFSVDPHPFKQLYTIQFPFKDVTGTAVYAFLPNKCQDTYRELFQSMLTTAMPAIYNSMSRLWRCSPSYSYSCIWSPHQPPGLFLPPDTSIMAKETAAWFGASLQERRRLQTVLWYDGWSCLFTSTWFDQWYSSAYNTMPWWPTRGSWAPRLLWFNLHQW